MNKLPDPLLREIGVFLDSNSLNAFKSINNNLVVPLDHEVIWHHMFNNEFPHKSLVKPDNISWKHYFNNAISTYLRIRTSLRLICKASGIDNNDNKVLKKGREMTQILKDAPKVSIEICAYHKCFVYEYHSSMIQFFGSVEYYSKTRAYTPLCLNMISMENAKLKSFFPFIIDHYTKYAICVDINNYSGKGATSIVGCNLFTPSENGSMALLYMAKDLTTYLEDIAYKFTSNYYTNAPNGTISLFKREPDSKTITKNICIEAVSAFVPDECEFLTPTVLSFYYSYQIRIYPVGEVSKCKLRRRTWVIKEANEIVDSVNGPGVIGLYPEVETGCEIFTYESCTTHRSSMGSMEGSFSFREEESLSEFNARIDPFKQEMPEGYEIIFINAI